MALMQLAQPEEHRGFHARAATSYTHLVARHQTDAVLSVACQGAADTHRVMTALWSKAAAASDPEASFFRLASQVTARALAVPGPSGARAGVMVEASRRSWTHALQAANIPLVFPASRVVSLEVPDFTSARDRLTGGLGAQQAGAVLAAQSRQQAGTVEGVLAGVRAYLLDAAVVAGDEGLLSVHARLAWLAEGGVNAGTVEGLVEHVRQVIGPVEMVRLAPYLKAAITPPG